jgi:hypothetical protein
MSCQRFREAIAGHAAGAELEPPAAAHLSACEACATRLEMQRRLLGEVDLELERTLAITASPALIAKVTAQIGLGTTRRPSWRPGAAWIGLAAAAAIAVAIDLHAPVSPPSVQPNDTMSAAPPAAAMAAAPPPASHPVLAPVRREATRRPTPGAPRRLVNQPAEEAPVIVDRSQLEAIARLHELLTSGQLTEKTLPSPRPPETAELAISPIEIPDIPVRAVDALEPGSEARGRQS